MKALLLVALLAGNAWAQAEGPAIADAQAKVALKLKDPESARFTNVTSDHGLVCGWVNAKNSYGGYVGFRPFAVVGDMAVLRDEEPAGSFNNHGLFASIWNQCNPPSGERFGDTLVDLPRLNIEKQCAKKRKASDKPQIYASCESNEGKALAWLQGHPTSEWIAQQCRVEARRYDSYSMTQSCVEEREADIVFRRGPQQLDATVAAP